jgi:hypothetical protein
MNKVTIASIGLFFGAAFLFLVLASTGCTISPDVSRVIDVTVNPDGVLDAVLETPLVELGKDTAKKYAADLLAYYLAGGGLTLGGLIGLFIKKPGTKKNTKVREADVRAAGFASGIREAARANEELAKESSHS